MEEKQVNLLVERVLDDVCGGKDYGQAIKDRCAEFTPDDSVLAETFSILLEADISWMWAQYAVVTDMISDPEINSWGHDYYGKDWIHSNNKEKANLTIYYLGKKTPAFRRGREVMDEYYSSTGSVFNIPDAPEGMSQQEAFRNSRAYSAIYDLYKSYLVGK